MCGIAGAFSYRGSELIPGLVDRMLDTIRHRGPDDGGAWSDGPVGIGNRRLSIIDISGGHQPMTSADGGIVLVFNGEIYNYKELAARLRRSGHTLRTASDTETILHLYEERGEDLVHDLRGMFAFALWDAGRGRLLLARDRLGIKPLYYANQGNRLVFGSEIKSLLQDDLLSARLDTVALTQYLTLKYVPAPATLFDGVAALPPGHLAVCDAGGLTVRRYWQPSFSPTIDTPGREEACAERLRELLQDSVRAHLVSDVAFGAFLSGGLDSSTVVALMSQALGRPVKTFSIGYDGDAASISELPYARLVAERFGTEHHEAIVRAKDFMMLSEKVAWHLDQPIADEACLPTYMLSELASRDVKMVLTGEGGDELFAGYARHSGERFRGFARLVPSRLRSLAVSASRPLPGLRRPKLALYALAQTDEASRFVSWFSLFDADRLTALLSEDVQGRVDVAPAAGVFRRHLAASDAVDPLSRMLYLDTTLWLPDDLLARGDKMAMAASVEARLPLLDHPLVEFAASLPPHLKLRGRTRKYLLRKVAAEWLPDPILNRKKQGFPTPVSLWFRGEAKEFLRDHLAPDTLKRRGLFEPSVVAQLLDEHDRGFADHGPLLYGLLAVELWHRAFVDKASRQATPAACVTNEPDAS